MKKRIFGMLLMGAMVVASVSMFTSCKDYDDDINKLQKQIDATALKTDLESLRSSLASDLATAKSALELAIEAKANASDLAGKANASDLVGLAKDEDLTALAATVAALSAQIEAIDDAIGENDIEQMATTIATVSGNMTALEKSLGEEEAARKAVEANLELQQKALDELAKQVEELAKKDNSYDDTAVKADIKKLQDAVKALQNANYASKSDLQKAINDLNAELSAKIPNVSILTALVNKVLTSITLVPELYIDGVEAIEFTSLKYTPAKFIKGANTKIFNDGIPTDLTSAGDAVIRDMAGTEASYRLSPKAVKLEDLDVDNIAVFNKTAKTQTRAATTTKNKPITFRKGSANLADGILTVTLQKTGAAGLKNGKEGSDIDIVSLMVPRKEIKEKNQTYEEIYSEFVRVVETTFTPRIAATPYYEGKKLKHVTPTDLTYHYSDSVTIWNDDAATANTKLVKQKIKYDAEFDLRTLVTGCRLDAGHEKEITKEELEKYGLEFRFAIPTTVYDTNAPHKTNQQKFAKIKDGHTLISCIENGTEKNRAATDKEPIIRVTLVDTQNSNAIVDLRYLKIKWIEDDSKDKDPVDLGSINKVIPFDCNAVDVNITWEQFINDIYGKKMEGKTDMSQTTFESIYPVANVQVSVNPTKDAEDGDISKPVVQNTTNKQGDALIANWTLDGVDFGKIPADGKTLTATITFKSKYPKSYGDLTLKWNVTRKLPAAPTLFGYNANQWFETGEKFYVQPVQYGTKDSKGVTRTDYVSYDFNVMQQFTVATATAKGTYLNWILKGVQDPCGSWDMQFAKNQVNKTYHPAYVTSSAISEPLTDEDVAYASYGAYELQKNPTATALKLNWLNAGHVSWKNKEDKPYAVLNGEKENATAIIPLLNNLGKDNEADNWTPKKTNDDNKSVTLTVWAKYNKWNWTPVTTFKAYLVTPIRINHEIDGVFEDNWISGTVVDALGKLGITDFVGYAVAKTASGKTGERYKYETQLWNYYGVQDPVFALGDNIKYGLKMDNGSLVVDNSIEVNADGSSISGGLTQSQVKKNTGGAYEWSLTATGGKLVFKNETGRAFDKKFNVFVPVTVKHYFGEVTMYVKIPVYPKGQAAADGKTVVPAV